MSLFKEIMGLICFIILIGGGLFIIIKQAIEDIPEIIKWIKKKKENSDK